jgi:hypothetical protein
MPKEIQNRSLPTESDPMNTAGLRDLYINYLEKISPDWDAERINLEAERVFVEYQLETSERNRQEFQRKIIQKLRKIEKFPNDWFFRNDNGLI